jgi:hypothetical protein
MSDKLVKIGVPTIQAQGVRLQRRVRQILDQHDAAVARLDAATRERLREALADEGNDEETAASTTGEPVSATA